MSSDPLGLFEDASPKKTPHASAAFAADPLGLYDEVAPQVMPT